MAEDNNNKSPIQELAAELRKQTGSSRKSVTSQTDTIGVTKKIGESVVKIEQLSKISHIKQTGLLEEIRDSLVHSAAADTQHKKEESRKGSLASNAFASLSKLPETIKKALTPSKSSGGGGGKGGSLIGDALGKLGLGSMMKGAGSGLADAAKSIAMMGLAIPAFLGGLAIGSKVLDAANDANIGDLDFAGLKKGMTGLASMINSVDEKTLITLGGLIGISAFAGIKGSKGTDAAVSLGLMGLSLTAFLGGLAVGSVALDAAAGAGYADLDFAGLKKGFSGLGEMVTSLDKNTLIVLGGMIGLAGFAGYKAGPKIAGSIALMGLSLSAFIGGLAVGNAILKGDGGDMKHLDFSALKKAFKGLSSSIGELSTNAVVALGSLVGVSGVFAAIKVNPVRLAGTMTMIGAGIVGFLGGFALGELALGAAGGVGIDLDFPAVKAAFKGFGNVVGSLSTSSIIALGAIIGAATFISKITQSPMKFGGSMFMIGAGIVGLLGGFAIGESLLSTEGANLDLEFPTIKKAVEGFNGIAESISLSSISILGGLVGSAVLLSKGGFANGAKFASAMIFIGAGIAGLLGGFIIGETALATVDLKTLEFEGIKSAMAGFSGVMGSLDAAAVAGLVGIMGTAVLLSKGGFATGAKFASAMTFIGAGIAGFLAGLGIGEVAVKAVGSISDLNFTSIKKAFAGFDSILGELSAGTLTAMAGLMAAGGILALIGGFGGGPMFALAMTGIGAGIGGFLMGFEGVAAAGGALGLDGSAIADLMKNVAEGAKEFEGLDMVNLATGIGLIGPAMLLLMGSEGLAGIGQGAKSLLEKLNPFSSGEDDSSGIFGKLNKILGDPSQLDMDAISRLTKSIDEQEVTSFSNSMGKITDALRAFSGDDQGFWSSVGSALTGLFKDDPFKPFLKLADKGDEMFKAGLGVEKIAKVLSSSESGSGANSLDKVVAFAKEIGDEQFKLDNAEMSLRSIAASVTQISQVTPPTGNIVGGGYDAVMGSEELRASQERLSMNQMTNPQTAMSTPAIVSADNSVVNNTSVSNFTSTFAPPSNDHYDDQMIFRATR